MPGSTFTSTDKNNKTKTLGQEIVEAVLAMTNRLNNSHHHHHHQKHGQKVGDPSQAGEEDGPTGSAIMLAGTNTGASMRSETGRNLSGVAGESGEEEEQLRTYVNSNFQAINNSIMLGGSYSSNDPGVHLEVVDYMEEEPRPEKTKKKQKKKNMGKKIVEESSHSKELRESD